MTNDSEVNLPAAFRERSLDPGDWTAIRSLGHRMVDDMLDYLEHVRARPAWQAIPDDVRNHFRTSVPAAGLGAAAVYDEFRRYILPYPTGNIHPRFWGWVMGAGTPSGMLAELLTGGMNANAWGSEQVASEVEGQVLAWFKELFGFPEFASGLLTTGGSVANLVGLCAARNARAGFDAEHGWDPRAPSPLLYCSTETHNSIAKSAAVLGFGAAAIRRIAVNADYTIDVTALRVAIEADHANGQRAFCIVGNAGTVTTGATDDLQALANLARAHGAWLHIDGAFGALATLAPGFDTLRMALAEADSLAFDLHKWLSVPYDCGCVLVRDSVTHRAAFSAAASYLAHDARGAAAGHHRFNELGLELSRGFRALKVWMLIKEYGVTRLGEQIAQNIAQARALGERIQSTPHLELVTPVALNVVCFRARPAGIPEFELNALNREVLLRLQERGIAVPSGASLGNQFVLRAAIVNHRSRYDDLVVLIDAVRAITAEVVEEMIMDA